VTRIFAASWTKFGCIRRRSEETLKCGEIFRISRGDQAQTTRRIGMKISVVIPAYNAERFMRRCLSSVFAQTLKPDEVIVVDDGSTDATASLAQELGARVVRRANGGLSAARNSGIDNASGDWIALLDADDMWAQQKLERQATLTLPGTVLVYTGIRIFDDSGERESRPAAGADSVSRMLRYRNPIAPSTVLVRREAVIQGGGFREDIRACEDWEMWIRLERLGKFVAIEEPLTDYYVHPNSLSANPARMLQAMDQIMDTTLLAGLRGFDRWSWKQRIRAVQLCSAGLIARDNGLKDELHYMFQSLRSWPSPFWEPKRFVMCAVSARNKFRRHEGAL
jgi:glycosyltransferase involved in cell wall biosynthesis